MRDFQSLFKGREDAHGMYFSIKGKQATDRGKLVSKAKSVNEPVTPELWKKHLSGEGRLGIIPVRADGKVGWFCIDVDFYKIGKKTLASVGGFEKIAQQIAAQGLNLVITKSKSGGAHLWAFLEEPMKAQDAYDAAIRLRDKLAIHDLLGIDKKEFNSHVDIFPKDFSPDNIGSWVNLPYFGDACHCVGADGKQDMPMPEFIKFANDRLTHPDDLRFKSKEEAQTKKARASQEKDMPPCIEFMLENGVPEGHRNDAVTQYAVFAKRAFPDDWEEKVQEFNDAACQPPMRKDELRPIINSVSGKDYQYLCNKIKDIFCDKEACKKRTFGVGRGAGGDIDIGITHMEKIDGEEPIYLITIGENKPFAVNVTDLYLYANFRKKAMGAINRLIPNLKQPDWEDILQVNLELMEVTEAAQDTQMRDRVIKQFQNWCSQSTITDGIDEAFEANCPFYDGKVIFFSGDGFLSQIDRQLRIERDQAYIYLRNWGVQIVEHTVKGKKQKVWCFIPTGPLWFDPYKGKQK
jgi:hypothetical protein